jgi:hypothetical protein
MGVLFSCCDKEPTFGTKVRSIVDRIKFSDDEEENLLKKKIVYKRYVTQVMYYESAAASVSSQYNFLRLMITIGSMLLPTLQTIQGNKKVIEYDIYIYWSSIIVSLIIMVCNGLVTLFKIDRTHVLYNLTSEKLKRAGWNYIERSGDYQYNKDGSVANYSDNLIQFFNEIEQIKLQTTMKEFGEQHTEHTEGREHSIKEPLYEDDQNNQRTSFLNKKLNELDDIKIKENNDVEKEIPTFGEKNNTIEIEQDTKSKSL